MHLIRNSMDHGLESKDARLAKGKPTEGTIWVKTELQGNQVVFHIWDDGAGLALGKLRQKAVEANLSIATAEEIANLIFYSGISTAEKVTDISGRGVGMDAVKRFLQEKGGDVVIVLKEGGDQAYRPFALRLCLPASYAIQL